MFIHDALNELITCGETDIHAAGLRVKVNHLKKIIPGSGITGFARQFQVDNYCLSCVFASEYTYGLNSLSFFVLRDVVICYKLNFASAAFGPGEQEAGGGRLQ